MVDDDTPRAGRGQAQAWHGMVGDSAAMRALRSRIRRVARGRGAVLILGESGVGKELVARALHDESTRRDAPFVAVNCAGIPAELLESEFFGHAAGAFTGAQRARTGLLAQVDGGTLLLDEVGDLPGALQAKLLRALQGGRVRPVGSEYERAVDVRFVAATHRDLGERVRQGRFRADLYFRLEAFTLDVPPLRARRGDIDALAELFLARHAREHERPTPRLGDAAREALRRYAFPGNVRELENALERAMAFCDDDVIGLAHLPSRMRRAFAARAQPPRGDSNQVLLHDGELPDLQTLQRRYARHVLARCEGNKRKAAQVLGIGRRTLYRWLEVGGDAPGTG